jgi:hypothetical protein
LEQFRRRWRKFGGRTPFHFAIDSDGNWLIWLDERAGSIIKEIIQAAEDKTEQIRHEATSLVELDSVRALIDLIPEKAEKSPGCTAKLFPPVGQTVQLHGVDGRSASGYFAREWLFLWWKGRFKGDEEWFKGHLSKPDQVVVNVGGQLRLHVVDAADLDALFRALSSQDEMTEIASKPPA